MDRAVVMAGGLGTRLRPYTTVVPKPLLPVGDRPILDIVVRRLADHGIRRITMATGHLAELVEAYFGDGSGHGVAIDYLREDDPLGTAGPIALLDDFTDDIVVMNGDILTELDVRELWEAHRASGAIATIAVQERTETVSLGVLGLDDAGDPTRITGIEEKPRRAFIASMGVYCFSPRIAAHLEPGTFIDFPDLVLRLLERGEEVRGWHSDAFWLDLGRPADYEQAQQEYAERRERLLGA